MPACSVMRPNVARIEPAFGGRGRVVRMTLEGNLLLSDIDGGNETALTDDGFVDADNERLRTYHFPTPSPDGDAIAFVRLEVSRGQFTQTVIIAELGAGIELRAVYTTSELNVPYIDWAPDGGAIAFLSINTQGGAIRAVSRAGGEVHALEKGAPTYWHWRSDSRKLLTHVGGRARTKGDPGRLSLIDVDGASGSEPVRLELLPGQFQSPHWSPDGNAMAYVLNHDNIADVLVLADAAAKPMCRLARITAGAFFAWSPDGAHIALIDTARAIQPGVLRLIDVRDGAERVLHEDANSFFWSPDGARLAVYSFVRGVSATPLAEGARAAKLALPASQPTPLMRIEMIDVTSGRKTLVANLHPTSIFGQYIGFFDQYSRAVSPWSPDGAHLVFSGGQALDRDSDIGVATVDESGSIKLSRLGSGALAFFARAPEAPR